MMKMTEFNVSNLSYLNCTDLIFREQDCFKTGENMTTNSRRVTDALLHDADYDDSTSDLVTQEAELMQALINLLKKYPDYTPPRVRLDGDIVIPLDVDLKKNRQRAKNLADAMSEWMSRDLGPRRSRTWVE